MFLKIDLVILEFVVVLRTEEVIEAWARIDQGHLGNLFRYPEIEREQE